jgi:hypothetical protein
VTIIITEMIIIPILDSIKNLSELIKYYQYLPESSVRVTDLVNSESDDVSQAPEGGQKKIVSVN